MNRLKMCAASVFWVSIVLPGDVMAHHSGAMFDNKETLTLQGTVREFQWTNPHCFVQLLVPSGGITVEWSIEMGSPTQIYRSSWRPHTLQPGQKVTIVVHPMRDGSAGGLFVSGTNTDGTPLGLKPIGTRIQ